MKHERFFMKLVRNLTGVFIFVALFSGTAWADSFAANGENPENSHGVLQSINISGKVTSSSDNKGLPGVTVLVKGTQIGVITDINGNYSIEVPNQSATLVFSYIGYETQEVLVGSRTVINLELIESVSQLDEVVVTALGITRKEKSLGYSVGTVEGDDLNKVVQENVMSSLAGKVSGVTINKTGGTGSSVSMVIRGASSFGDNQPLFVVDGVPMINGLNNMTQIGDRNVVDYGNAISDLNSDDIKSVSILKGPSAAALYGTRAGDGVVLITTKKGKGKKGVTVSVNSNTVFDRPYKYFEVNTQFASGYFSFTPDDFPAGTVLSVEPAEAAGAGIENDRGYFALQWHSPLDANGNKVPIELVSYPDNVKNFVQTGITSTNGVSITNQTDIMNYRIGVANMSSKGIIPSSDLFRNNFSIGSDVKATDKITISSNINITKSWSNNRPSSNRGTNPLEWAYKVPSNINILDLQDYWEPGQEGVQQRTPANGIYDNPYFLANEVSNSFGRDRMFGNLKAVWQITPEISLMGKYSMDSYSEKRETKISPSYTRELNNGAYGIVEIINYERNADFLATYSKEFNKFGIVASAGGNNLRKKSSSISNSSRSTEGLIIPNLYTVQNITSSSLVYSNYRSQRAIYSVYGLMNLSFDNMIYLDLTARNDWSSTLPEGENSYFYPSASLSLLLNEMVDMGSSIDLLKLRGGWAQVGNDTSPYNLYANYGNAGQWGEATQLAKSGTLKTPNLKPEEATSMEFGIDLSMVNNRIRFEGTYYEVGNKNQIIPGIPLASSSGYSSVTINAGLIESRGWEFLVGLTPVKTNQLVWDVNVNLSRNRTKLTRLAEGIEFMKFWSDAKGGAWTYVGDDIGDLYDADIIRVEDENSPYYQYPIVGGSNYQWQVIESSDTKNKIGNYNPDFLLGLQSRLTYKGCTLDMTVDWRSGGQFVSQTYRYSGSDAINKHWLESLINPDGRTGQELRDWLVANEDEYIINGFNVVGGPTVEYGGFEENYSGVYVADGTFVPGVIDNGDGTYTERLTEEATASMPLMPYVVTYPWDLMAPSTFDADFIKLREISLSYQIPRTFSSRFGVQDVSVSVYSRNIVLWTKAKIGIDPERAFQAESGGFKQGIERYNVEPWVVPIGFKLNLTF